MLGSEMGDTPLPQGHQHPQGTGWDPFVGTHALRDTLVLGQTPWGHPGLRGALWGQAWPQVGGTVGPSGTPWPQVGDTWGRGLGS